MLPLLDTSPSPFGRLRYHARHRGLALALQLAVRWWHQSLSPQAGQPSISEVKALRKRFVSLLDQDVRNVAEGIYPESLLHQFPLADYIRFFPDALRELVRVQRRKQRGLSRDVSPPSDGLQYPRYYLQNFHWQTGGWLSDHSARLYDVGVEFLFLGTADIMRRMAIRPLVENLSSPKRPLRILDIACGTGRFMTQVRQALPHASLVGVDLSPNYIRRARRLTDSATDSSFVHANAESMPFDNGFFDAVTSIFLFHELPRDARRRVMKEALRVLKPGGLMSVCDSAQLVGNEDISEALRRFPMMYHEPFYKGFLVDPVAGIMEDVGFLGVKTQNHMVSSVTVGHHPG